VVLGTFCHGIDILKKMITGLLQFSDILGRRCYNNYFHSIDLAIWDGDFVPATTTDPNEFPPADANYALFTGLTNDAITISAVEHPSQPGPVGISGFQIVADAPTVATDPTDLMWSVNGDQLTLSWLESHLGWTLQMQMKDLDVGFGTNWVDVAGSTTVGVIVPGTGPVEAYSFTLDSADHPMFAWQDGRFADDRIYFRWYDGTQWAELAGSATADGVSGTGGRVIWPSLAVDLDDRPIIAWTQWDGNDDQIYLRKYDGASWVGLGGSATGGGVTDSTMNSVRALLGVSAAAAGADIEAGE